MSQRTRTPSPRGPTVLDVLQRPDPDLNDVWARKTYDNTIGARSVDVVVLDNDHPTVKPWTDFTFDAITLAYGDILGMGINTLRPDYRRDHTPEPNRITGLINFNSVHWWSAITRKPLKGAATILRPRFSPSNTDTDPAFLEGWINWRVPFNPSTKVQPGWTVSESNLPILIRYREDHHKQPEKPLVYLVGRTHLKQKWKSSWLERKDDDLTVRMDPPFGSTDSPRRNIRTARMTPLHQMAKHCRYSQTRYAFILTQAELVALRIRRLPKPDGDLEKHYYAGIEYASVPWGTESGFTVNLALWALACMGMNDEHREMEAIRPRNSPLEAMARLTWWKYDKKNGIYENVISKRQITAEDWNQDLEGKAFVHLTEEDGNSFTRDFLPNPEAGTAQPSASEHSIGLTQQMETMNLENTPPTQPARQAKCVIDGETYTATYKKEQKKWEVILNDKAYLVEYEKKQKLFIRHEGGNLAVKWGSG